MRNLRPCDNPIAVESASSRLRTRGPKRNLVRFPQKSQSRNHINFNQKSEAYVDTPHLLIHPFLIDNGTPLTFRECGLCYWCTFALSWMVKCQYHDILNTVSTLFVVVLGGNDNECDKSMQLRIIPN